MTPKISACARNHKHMGRLLREIFTIRAHHGARTADAREGPANFAPAESRKALHDHPSGWFFFAHRPAAALQDNRPQAIRWHGALAQVGGCHALGLP
ncbi:MAG: hypothetical protein RI907_2643 [Pseudomonadota bacterium]|jgi:hypothetical protein